MQLGEMISFGPGQQLHARSDGPCQWGAIQLTVEDFVQYGGALRGTTPIVPALARWRPPRAALRQLRHLHQAAIRAAEARSGVLADREAAHGLEQQVIHALVESLSARPVYKETELARRHREILARFEELLEPELPPTVSAIGAAIGVSQRLLRECCRKNLGMDRAVTAAFAGCSERAARCGVKTRILQAYRQSPTATGSAISAVLL
jgi:hypothetical protein